MTGPGLRVARYRAGGGDESAGSAGSARPDRALSAAFNTLAPRRVHNTFGAGQRGATDCASASRASPGAALVDRDSSGSLAGNGVGVPSCTPRSQRPTVSSGFWAMEHHTSADHASPFTSPTQLQGPGTQREGRDMQAYGVDPVQTGKPDG